MKYLFTLIAIISITSFSFSQVRKFGFKTIGKDSVDLSLTSEYNMVEDSCAQIIRHGHLNYRIRKFTGPFKDVSKANKGVILSEGAYTADGLKNGVFTSRYVNGNIQSKGAFKNNQFDGHWELYYEDGKPQLFFDADNTAIRITDAWTASGKNILTKVKVLTPQNQMP